MEKPLTLLDCENLKGGENILINACGKDMLVIFMVKLKVAKYPITENGRKCRSLGRVNKQIQTVYADEVGDSGNEEIMEYDFMGQGSFTIKEESDLRAFNARIISEKHPLYDKKSADSAKQVQGMFKAFEAFDKLF